jgi:hypothetical protein
MVMAVSVFACSQPTAVGVGAKLQAARSRWTTSEPNAYQFTLQRECFCAPLVTRAVIISVRNHAVENRRYEDDGSAVGAALADEFPNIDGVFDEISAAIASGARTVTVGFDDTRGFPMHVFIDYRGDVADDELTLQIRDFAVK